ncbi:hypothetical protein HN587_01495 [Candidatus Woesearchaeota archaeon]|jgi:hypothetical protein|nr:hypothetical protein [Candidatus Woesearchaeota archaeon]
MSPKASTKELSLAELAQDKDIITIINVRNALAQAGELKDTYTPIEFEEVLKKVRDQKEAAGAPTQELGDLEYIAIPENAWRVVEIYDSAKGIRVIGLHNGDKYLMDAEEDRIPQSALLSLIDSSFARLVGTKLVKNKKQDAVNPIGTDSETPGSESNGLDDDYDQGASPEANGDQPLEGISENLEGILGEDAQPISPTQGTQPLEPEKTKPKRRKGKVYYSAALFNVLQKYMAAIHLRCFSEAAESEKVNCHRITSERGINRLVEGNKDLAGMISILSEVDGVNFALYPSIQDFLVRLAKTVHKRRREQMDYYDADFVKDFRYDKFHSVNDAPAVIKSVELYRESRGEEHAIDFYLIMLRDYSRLHLDRLTLKIKETDPDFLANNKKVDFSTIVTGWACAARNRESALHDAWVRESLLPALEERDPLQLYDKTHVQDILWANESLEDQVLIKLMIKSREESLGPEAEDHYYDPSRVGYIMHGLFGSDLLRKRNGLQPIGASKCERYRTLPKHVLLKYDDIEDAVDSIMHDHSDKFKTVKLAKHSDVYTLAKNIQSRMTHEQKQLCFSHLLDSDRPLDERKVLKSNNDQTEILRFYLNMNASKYRQTNP